MRVILPVIVLRDDTDTETLDLIQMEIAELDGVEEPCIMSSDNIVQCLETVEDCVEKSDIISTRDPGKPFFMALEQVNLEEV